MDYFRLQQLQTKSKYLYPKFEYDKNIFWMTDQPVLCNYQLEDQHLPTLPLYDHPTFIVNTCIQKILQDFQINIQYRPLYYGHEHACKGFIIQLPTIDCLHSSTVFHKNGWLKTPMLDSLKIGSHKAFMIADILEEYFVVDLEILEHILYTQTTQFLFEPIKIQEDMNHE